MHAHQEKVLGGGHTQIRECYVFHFHFPMLYVNSFPQSNCSPAMILLCILSMITISMVSRNSFTCLPSSSKQLISCN